MGKKKIFSTRVDRDRIKALKHLSVDTGRSLGDLLEEAIQDLLKKHRMSMSVKFLRVDTSESEDNDKKR